MYFVINWDQLWSDTDMYQQKKNLTKIKYFSMPIVHKGLDLSIIIAEPFMLL